MSRLGFHSQASILFLLLFANPCQSAVIEGKFTIKRDCKCVIVTKSGETLRTLYSTSERGECDIFDFRGKWKSTIDSTFYRNHGPSKSSISNSFEFGLTTTGVMRRDSLPATGALHLFPLPFLGYELFTQQESDSNLLEKLSFPDYKLLLAWAEAERGKQITGFVELAHHTDLSITGIGFIERDFSDSKLSESRSQLRIIVDVSALRDSPHMSEVIREIPEDAKLVFFSKSSASRK